MSKSKLKGWLVLPEFAIKASEITSIHDPGMPDEDAIKAVPSLANIKPRVQISQKGRKGVMISYEPYDRVMELFTVALSEGGDDNDA